MKTHKRIISFLLVVLMCAGLFSCMPNLKKYVIMYADERAEISEEIAQSASFERFLDKMNKFAIDITMSVSDTTDGVSNFCIAPSSVVMSLAVAVEGSDGETRQEMLDALGVNYDTFKKYIKYYYSLYNRNYTYIDDYGVEQVSAHEILATSIWLDTDVKYNIECIDSLATEFNCDSFSISFGDGTGSKLINQYIEYKTHSVVPGNASISRDTDVSIVSLFHLKEVWNELGKSLTFTVGNEMFTNNDKSTVEKQLLKSSYMEGQIYNAGRYTSFHIETKHGYRLYFIVPNSIYTLDDVFTVQNINTILSRADDRFVDNVNKKLHYTRVIFPQIEISFSGDISENLKNDFNITSLFDKEACDLSNLAASDVYCNGFIHNTRMSIDMKGIEGATINQTQPSIKDDSEHPDYEKEYHEYLVNRAFGFVLTDADGLILYSGRVNTVK